MGCYQMNENDKQYIVEWFKKQPPEDRKIIKLILNIVAIDLLNKETKLVEELENEMLEAESKIVVSKSHSLNWYGVEKRIKDGTW